MMQNKYTVFFDIENHIFNIDHKNNFLEYFLIETIPARKYAKDCYKRYLRKSGEKLLLGVSKASLNKYYFKNFSGMSENLLSEIANSWFDSVYKDMKEDLFFHKSIFDIDMHKRNGGKVVLLSTSFLSQVKPLLKELGIDEVVCSQLEVLKGYYTGNIISDPLSELGKVKVMKNYLEKSKVSYDSSLDLEEEDLYQDYYHDYEIQALNSGVVTQ